MIEALRTTPWSHQRDAANFAWTRGTNGSAHGTLLDMDMGTGKSLVSIMMAHAWGCRRVLVTCPHSVVGVWPREMRDHSALDWVVARCDKKHPSNKTGLSVRAKRDLALHKYALASATDEPLLVVVNHESIWREPFGTWAMGVKWDLLIVDECHRAKAPGGKLSRYLFRLSKNVSRRLGLSGTPLPHSPLDFYAQARFLDRRIVGRTYVEFKNKYAVTGGFNNKQVVAFKNMDEFANRFSEMSYSAKKEDVLDLPAEVDEIRTCRLEPPAQKVYDDLDRGFWAAVADGEITAANALSKLLRLQQVACGDLPLDDGRLAEVSFAKTKLLVDFLRDLPKREPVVVFCRFTADIERVKYIAAVLGRRYGELSGRDKGGLTPDSTMHPDIDILGTQIQAGGVGIDLTRACFSFYYSFGFSLGDYLQSRARLHRPGQKRSVTHVHGVVEDTVDITTLHALRKREKVIESILNRGDKSG